MVGTNSQYNVFKNKLRSKEALSIRKQIKDFTYDFEQKSNNGFFKDPEAQSKCLRKFLNNISKEIIENPLWENSDKKEKESALVETEKLITKKFFDITFGPPEDEENDLFLSHKILLHSWIEPRHFDLPEFPYSILEHAGNELCKINLYKFYIDKLVCIVNCMKLIECNYQKYISREELTRDKHIALLIFIILKTNPNKLFSNVKYILRYINRSFYSIDIYKTTMENVVYAITYIIELCQNVITVTTEEYNAKVNEVIRDTNEELEAFTQSSSIYDEINRENTSDAFIQSLLLKYGTNNDDEASDEIYDDEVDDFPYQGIFNHLESFRSTSIYKNGSFCLNDFINPRKESKDWIMNFMNEHKPNSYINNLSDEEKKILNEIEDDILRVYFNG